MKIILIGNYPKDNQESMERFAQMLLRGFNKAGIKTEIWRPRVFFGLIFTSTTFGIGKWLGYLDKWLVSPFILRWFLVRANMHEVDVYYHVCDHSNSPYLKYLPFDRTAITCHDVLAIRGALGFANTYCYSSFFGKILQKWILTYLLKAELLVTVSKLTLEQLLELAKPNFSKGKNYKVIYNALNAKFENMSVTEAEPLLKKKGLSIKQSFILHVGSALERKNRKLLLNMVAYLGAKWNGWICFAGKPLDQELLRLSESLALQSRVVSIVNPDHKTLVALYSSCQAFIFPSYSEGFGWPLIEAQACGAPVIASNVSPMPEISGGAAIHADPDNSKAFGDALLALRENNFRKDLIQRGLTNIYRFEEREMINKYLNLYDLHKHVETN